MTNVPTDDEKLLNHEKEQKKGSVFLAILVGVPIGSIAGWYGGLHLGGGDVDEFLLAIFIGIPVGIIIVSIMFHRLFRYLNDRYS